MIDTFTKQKERITQIIEDNKLEVKELLYNILSEEIELSKEQLTRVAEVIGIEEEIYE